MTEEVSGFRIFPGKARDAREGTMDEGPAAKSGLGVPDLDTEAENQVIAPLLSFSYSAIVNTNA